jgi:hypothetical protein
MRSASAEHFRSRLDRGPVFGNLPPAVIRNLSDDFQQLDRSNPQQDCWHIEIKPQSDKLLEKAIGAVEAKASSEQNAKSATLASSSLRAKGSVAPSQPANYGLLHFGSLATLWGIFRRAGDDAQIPGEARPGRSGRDTWLTELLARASRRGQ